MQAAQKSTLHKCLLFVSLPAHLQGTHGVSLTVIALIGRQSNGPKETALSRDKDCELAFLKRACKT